MASMPLALYLHIPFCAARCRYCDFNTYAGLDALFGPYVAALEEEIRIAGGARGHPTVRTIFVGGGTPTLLPPALLRRVLDACREAFAVVPGAEITAEANPGTLDVPRFAALREMGVNRLSMGVQSFDDGELRWLGRIHSATEAQKAFGAARRSGFENVSLDFILGLPGQRAETWATTLDRALALGPEHLSLYSLTVEEGTPLADSVLRGLDATPDDDATADLYLDAVERLSAAGYVQYEISNFARPGYECRHNLVYWRDEPYLGFGAGAHSFDFDAGTPGAGRRWWNVAAVPAYIERIAAGREAVADDEAISPRLAMGEVMMVGLRLVEEGVADARFRARFGVGLQEAFGETIARLVTAGLLERMEGGVRLSVRGRLLGNQAFAEFLP